MVGDLYADTTATPSSKESALVSVIDNSTGATLTSCTITSAGNRSCFNAVQTGVAGAGDNIEVKITAATGSRCIGQWRVRFRY
jgi:hypothetical protein